MLDAFIIEQLKQRDRDKRCTLSADSNFLVRWDMLTAFALLYTALVTPFEVSFLPAAETLANPWFIINRAIDTVFLCFLVDEEQNKGKGLMMADDDLRSIVQKYEAQSKQLATDMQRTQPDATVTAVSAGDHQGVEI